MVHHDHQITGIPKGASIAEHRRKTFSLGSFCKVYLAAITRWCRLKKSSSSSSSRTKSKYSSSSSAIPQKSFNSKSDRLEYAHEEIDDEEEENTMKGGQRRRDSAASSPDSYTNKHKSLDSHNFPHIAYPRSRNGSRKSASPSPSFLYRSSSRGSMDSNYGISATPSLSRTSSKMSSTPIMFSNSMGFVKPPTVEKILECSLEELCYGCKKKIKVTRDVLTNNGQIIEEEEILTINVKAGWKKGTKITFEGMGNEIPGSLPADITFVIAEKRHPLFQRIGDDLEITIEIPLLKALTSCDISIPLLDGNDLSLVIEDIIHPGYEKIIEGHGMPSTKHKGKRGNLKVVFLVKFPTDLTEDQRGNVFSILQDSC